MVQRLGLAPEILRYYERLGLLPPPARNVGRFASTPKTTPSDFGCWSGSASSICPSPIAAKLATMFADGRCGEVSDELRAYRANTTSPTRDRRGDRVPDSRRHERSRPELSARGRSLARADRVPARVCP
jgi:hypothetical protein